MDAILSATRCPECLLLVYQQIITQTHIIGKFAAYYVVSLNVHMPPKKFKCNFSIYCFCFAIFLFVLEMRKTHRQLIICSILVAQKNCSILRMCVCILVVEKTIVADICSLLVCSYFAPKILGVFFLFFVCLFCYSFVCTQVDKNKDTK